MATWAALEAVVRSNPTSDFRDEIAGGKITTKNAADKVREVALANLVREGARAVVQDAQHPMATMARRAVRDAADQLIESLRPKFDEAAGQLAASVDLLGDLDAAVAARASVALAQAYEQQRAATKELDAIRAVRLGIGDACGEERSAAWYLAGPLSAEDLERARPLGSRFVDLIRAGYGLRLNSRSEAAALVAAAEAAQAA
jgi:hypothetical protein